MKGLEVALVGRLARDAEPRTSRAGNPMVVLNVAVDEGDGADVTWVKVLAFHDQAEACAGLAKRLEIYCEGRLKAEAWSGREGEPRVNLTVLARLVQPLGRIGHKRPAPAARRTARAQPPPARADDHDDVPFDDVHALEEIGR